MRAEVRERNARRQLPIQIRYRAQDYETRYLDDPRVQYVEAFHETHADDGFFAFIPSETAAAAAAKGNLGNKWWTLGWAAMTLASLSWIVYRLFSIF